MILARSIVARLIHATIRSILRVTSRSGKIASGVAVRGEGGVAGEMRVIGEPKFHSWGRCTMPLTNINSDWMPNASSGLCIILLFILYYGGPLSCILGCKYYLFARVL